MYYSKTTKVKLWQAVLFGVIFMAVGIGLLVLSANTIKEYNKKNETYIETTAEVVSYNYNDEGLEAIVVEYEVNGEYYTKASNSYSNMAKSLGTQVSIKYNPEYPADAIWTNDSTNIILPVMGAIFTIAGLAVVIGCLKRRK